MRCCSHLCWPPLTAPFAAGLQAGGGGGGGAAAGLVLSDEVAQALREGRPVVALVSILAFDVVIAVS